MRKAILTMIGILCFAFVGKAQDSIVSVPKEVKAYLPLNDTVTLVKDSLTFEQRVEMINRKKRKQDSKLLRFEAGITGGFCGANNDSYMVELTFAYYPLVCAGVSFGLEWNDDRGGKPLVESLKDANGYEEYDPNRVTKINLNPSLAFRTPTLWFNKRHSSGLMLHCDPGFCLSVLPVNDRVTFDEVKDSYGVGHPASFGDSMNGENVVSRSVRNHGGKWFFWRVKSALTFRAGDVFLSLGWVTSNYNMEYCRNNIRYTNGKRYNGIDRFKHTNTIFASITGQF